MFNELVKDILSWKQKYKIILGVEIGDNSYIYRLLTRGEYFNLLSLQKLDPAGASDILLEICMLHPEYVKDVMDDRLAGEVDFVIQSIIKSSGFSNGDNLIKDIDVERNNIGMLDNQIVLTICKAFPQLTPDDIDKLNYHQLLYYLVLAEEILGVKLNIEKPQDKDKIDFDKDNRELSGGPRSPFNERKSKRGDVSK